jgi:MFS family permease
MVSDALRGRVMAVYSMMFMGMAPLGSLLAGVLSERIGAPTTVAISGGASIVVGLLFWTRLPAFRPQARELIISQQSAGRSLPETGGVSESAVRTEK